MSETNLKTNYPILLIHGAGFRDLKWPLYWGRIPKILTQNGAELFYGEQDCWASVEDNAKALKARIGMILEETGTEKVNLIAHSKGGLEARMVASSLGFGEHIASITTIGTPHRGSKTIDRIIKMPSSIFNVASFAVNNWIGLFGDTKPDFYTVCKSFTTEYAARFNEMNPDVPGILYQSYAGIMRSPFSDVNLWIANLVVDMIEGKNDGLVTARSAQWGEKFTLLRGNGRRGVSHYDEIDFRRRPISKKNGDGVKDICDVYLAIIEDLIVRGL